MREDAQLQDDLAWVQGADRSNWHPTCLAEVPVHGRPAEGFRVRVLSQVVC